MSLRKLNLLLASSVIVLLPGCAVVGKFYDAYFMAKYDTNEYGLINKIRTVSELAVEECKDRDKSITNFKTLYYTSTELKNFTQHIPNNPDASKLAGNMVELSKQGKEMYDKSPNVSENFCKLKLQQINRSADTAQKAIGAKPR